MSFRTKEVRDVASRTHEWFLRNGVIDFSRILRKAACITKSQGNRSTSELGINRDVGRLILETLVLSVRICFCDCIERNKECVQEGSKKVAKIRNLADCYSLEAGIAKIQTVWIWRMPCFTKQERAVGRQQEREVRDLHWGKRCDGKDRSPQLRIEKPFLKHSFAHANWNLVHVFSKTDFWRRKKLPCLPWNVHNVSSPSVRKASPKRSLRQPSYLRFNRLH